MNVSSFDTKPVLFGGLALAAFSWMYTGSPLVAAGIGLIAKRIADRQESLAEQSEPTFIDANFQPVPLPPAPAPAPVTNHFSPTVNVNPPRVTVAPRWDNDRPVQVNVTAPANPQSWDSDRPVSRGTSLSGEEVLSLAIKYPAVLVYGAPGSGKSTVAKWIVEQRHRLGHQVTILDPHQVAGQWSSEYELVGKGKDYSAIDQKILQFSQTIAQRYHRLAEEFGFKPRPYTVVAEELTQWSKKCEQSVELWDLAIADVRKANAFILFISHGRNMGQLGGGSGAATRDETLLEIQLFAEADPANQGQSKPAMKGTYKLPNSTPIPFDVPKLSFAKPLIDPLEIPNKDLPKVLKMVAEAVSIESMKEFLLVDCEERKTQSVKLWDLVKSEGVSRALDVLAPDAFNDKE